MATQVQVPPGSERSVGSVILTPERKLTVLLLKVLIFLDGFTQDGLKNVVNVYLVAAVGWSPTSAAIVWLIEMATRIVYQPLIGTVVDRVKVHKYTILVIIGVLKILSGVCILASTNFGVMALKSVIDGVVDASVLSTITAMTLGVVGKTRFHKKAAAANNIFKFAGAGLGVLVFGFLSYGLYPDVRETFWVLVAGGALMLVCAAFMLPDSNHATTDHRLARGRSVMIEGLARQTSVQNMANAVLPDLTDDEDTDGEEPKAEDEAGAEETPEQPAPERRESSASFQANTEALSYTQVMTYRQMYADPKRRKSLIFLSLVFFTYHLANSTTGPLLGQYLALRSDARNGLPIMTGLMLTNFVFKLLTNWFLSGDRASSVGYARVLQVGSAALCLRLVLVAILVRYAPDSPWGLGATQILEGIGGGCVGLMLMLYSHLLSRRTGHFNFNMAVVNAWKTLGSMAGIVVGGVLADYASYELAFGVLAGVSVLPIAFSFGISVPDLKRLD